jgi:hypothetical protein
MKNRLLMPMLVALSLLFADAGRPDSFLAPLVTITGQREIGDTTVLDVELAHPGNGTAFRGVLLEFRCRADKAEASHFVLVGTPTWRASRTIHKAGYGFSARLPLPESLRSGQVQRIHIILPTTSGLRTGFCQRAAVRGAW